MYTRSWHVVKDETARTFEVVEQASNENAFTNRVIAMQRDGMLVNFVIMPVTNKNASKDSIKMNGYSREDGLYDRLLKQHQEIIRKQSDFWVAD